MNNLTFILAFILPAFAGAVAADRQCFQCIYKRNDKESIGGNCLRPTLEDNSDMSIKCGDATSVCAKLYYVDKVKGIEFAQRSCMPEATCSGSGSLLIPDLGVSGKRVCCKTDNCNGGSVNHACSAFVAMLVLSAVRLAFPL